MPMLLILPGCPQCGLSLFAESYCCHFLATSSDSAKMRSLSFHPGVIAP